MTAKLPAPPPTGAPVGGVKVRGLSARAKELLLSFEGLNADPHATPRSIVASWSTKIDVAELPAPAQVLAVAPHTGDEPSDVEQVQTPIAPAFSALPTLTVIGAPKLPPLGPKVGGFSLKL